MFWKIEYRNTIRLLVHRHNFLFICMSKEKKSGGGKKTCSYASLKGTNDFLHYVVSSPAIRITFYFCYKRGDSSGTNKKSKQNKNPATHSSANAVVCSLSFSVLCTLIQHSDTHANTTSFSSPLKHISIKRFSG